MDWGSIITYIITFITGGGIVGLVTLKATKRKAGAEADNAVIDALRNAIAELREIQTDSTERENKKDEQLAEKDAKIEELHKQLADKRCENTTKGYYLCVHQGCVLRRPSLGRGKEYYDVHSGEEDFGADFLSVEELLKQRKNETKKESNN